MINFAQIYEGWKNKLIPPANMKNFIELTSKDRTDVCLQCEHHSENKKKNGYRTVRLDHHCTDCGCTLAAKTRCLSCECPLKKWTAVLNQEEEYTFKKEVGYEEPGKQSS